MALAVLAYCSCGHGPARPPAQAAQQSAPPPVVHCAAVVADQVIAPSLDAEPNLTRRMSRLQAATEALASVGRTSDAWDIVDRATPARVAVKGIAGIVVGAIRAGNADDASEALAKLMASDAWTRSPALVDVVTAYRQAEAPELAAEVARRIPDPERRARALARLGEVGRSANLLEEAAAAVGSVPPGTRDVFMEGGTFEMETAAPQLSIMLDLVAAWLRLDEPRRAEGVVAAMGRFADERLPFWKAQGQVALADYWVPTNPRSAKEALALARRLIDRLDRGLPARHRVVGDIERRVELLTRTSRLYAKLHMKSEAREAATVALETARDAESIDEPTVRAAVASELHVALASALVAIGARDDAIPVLERALAIAQEGPLPPRGRGAGPFHARSSVLASRVEALAHVAALLAKVGNTDRSTSLLGRAKALAAEIPDAPWRATAWSSIAKAWLEEAGPRQALTVVAAGADADSSRVAALSRLGRAAADAREWQVAVKACRAMAPGYGKAALAAELSARAYAVRDPTTARALWREAIVEVARCGEGWEMALMMVARSPAARQSVDEATARAVRSIPGCSF